MSDIRIQDDLFEYVNHNWLEQAVIPEDKPSTGGFATLRDEVEKLLIKDLNEMCERGEYPNELVKNACLLYSSVKNVKKRNKDGIKPVLKDLAKVYKLTSVSQLNRNLKEFVLANFPLPFEVGVEVDMKDTSKHCVAIQGPSTILPDTTYYKEEMKAQKEMMIGLWSNSVSQMLAMTKLTAEEQALFLSDTLKFDELIAKYVKSREEWSEYANIYNPMTTRRVSSLLKPIKFRKLLQDLFTESPETIMVADPRWLKGFKEIFNEENFELYKHWAYVKLLLSASSVLSEDLRDLGGAFMRALQGVQVMQSAEKFAFNLATMAIYDNPVGLYYGEKYFGEAAKKDVVDMVYSIINKYKERVKNNPILADETKEKAILKLSTMKVKMGYPDKVEDIYSKLVFDETKSLYGNMCSFRRIITEDKMSELNKPVDRTKWAMPGHMVNACYDPFSNDITFPAAILQPPFYSINQSRSQNLGGIGAVIGHEISHAFDNNGAKFDENGNLKNWWTKEDFKRFNQKTKAMIKQFDGIELPWGKVNGTLVVSENIADNGGMAVTLDIMGDLKDASYEEYFKNWARVWCIKAKDQYKQLLLTIDVHGPAVLRANIPPRNFSEWYETFNVKKTDKMYIAPNKRIVIW